MKQFFERLDHCLTRLYRISGYIAALCLVAIAMLVFTSILSRIFLIYIPGLTEYSGYAMAGASFLAFAYTFENRGHIRVEVLISRLDSRIRWYIEVWCLLIGSIVSMLLAVYFARLVYWSWKFQEHSEGSDAILLWKPQSLVLAGATLLAVCVVHHLVKHLFTRPCAPH